MGNDSPYRLRGLGRFYFGSGYSWLGKWFHHGGSCTQRGYLYHGLGGWWTCDSSKQLESFAFTWVSRLGFEPSYCLVFWLGRKYINATVKLE